MSWTIYGNKYDLSEFIDKHPGGKDILVKTKDMGDVTALFESYHAFSNKSLITESLEKYKIESSSEITEIYDFTTYKKLNDLIKEQYKFKRSNIKAPLTKICYITFSLISYAFVTAYCIKLQANLIKIPLGFLLGFIWISLGFNVMHDASHYALFYTPRYNNYASMFWNSFSLWNHSMWLYHHVFYHHSFTNTINDSDIYHIMPLFRKHHSQKQGWLPPYLYPLVAFTIPGAFYGQALMYMFLGTLMGIVFVSPLKVPMNCYSLLDGFIFSIRILLFYEMGLWCSVSHMIACSVFYKANVIGDHDTFEVSVTNHYEGKDWLRLQVQNSGNFKTDSSLYTYVFGGINYQIEHHLFPNMSNCFYSQISPTVQQFCKDSNFPYVVHKYSLEVFQEYYKNNI